MTFNEYQLFTKTTAKYPEQGKFGGLNYTILGLIGEAGELANKLKKVVRDDNGVLTENRKQDLIAEAGDCVWYISQLATELDTTLEGIVVRNVEKLTDRKNRGVIKGSGDNR